MAGDGVAVLQIMTMILPDAGNLVDGDRVTVGGFSSCC